MLTICLCAVPLQDTCYAREELELYSNSCALMDGTSGRVLYGKSEEEALSNASTTKILTCIIALEKADEDDIVTVSANAAAQPKVHLGMKAGDRFVLRDLLYGLILESYNDCAVAIAEHVAGSVQAFAELMNEKAEEIGCENTHFVTPNGLDQEDEGGSHHTTAKDLCRIMKYCAWESKASEDFLEICQTRDYYFAGVDGGNYSIQNHNQFLSMMEQCIAGKTGFTAKAGYCYVAAVEDNGRKYCIALLGCGWPNNKNYKWKDARKLFDYGLDNYKRYVCRCGTKNLKSLQVGNGYTDLDLSQWGTHPEVELYVEGEGTELYFLKADWESAVMETNITSEPKIPVTKQEEVGELIYRIDGEELYRFPIKTQNCVYEWNWKDFCYAALKNFICFFA